VRGTATGRPWADRRFDLRIEDHPEPLVELRRLLRLARAYERSNRGDELATLQRWDEAGREYAAAAALAPEIAELPFWHAAALATAGRLDEARPLFAAVFAREPRWRELVPRLPAAGLLPDDAELIAKIVAIGDPSRQPTVDSQRSSRPPR
jgi:tetratricopeptide (TPR) repeat protein